MRPLVLWVRRSRARRGWACGRRGGGARASGAGCARARVLARELAQKGVVVISGGAFGIDAAAPTKARWEGCCRTHLRSFWLWRRRDLPRPSRPALRRVLRPKWLAIGIPTGNAPRAGQFPARNRIIAALGDAVVVVEAAHRSGALITAALSGRWADLCSRSRAATVASSPAAMGHARGPSPSAADVEETLAEAGLCPWTRLSRRWNRRVAGGRTLREGAARAAVQPKKSAA